MNTQNDLTTGTRVRLRSPWSDLVGTVLGPVTDNPLRVQVIWDGTGAVTQSLISLLEPM